MVTFLLKAYRISVGGDAGC
ncbi:hypothetical protein SS209_03736 [Salmonella enterica subsp. enterica serovar Senftenberg str. SS209]|nr:hypothetical protein SS209_03736 [Salmonella enterica subsp. enterica serovar Senftenberg str. SS209]